MNSNYRKARLQIENHNLILSVMTEPMTVEQIGKSSGLSLQLTQYYLNSMMKNAQNAKEIVTRYRSTKHRSANNIPMYVYLKSVESITKDDLVEPTRPSRSIYASADDEVPFHQPILTGPNVRTIKLMSSPTPEQRKALDDTNVLRRKEIRKKAAAGIGGNSVLDSAFL